MEEFVNIATHHVYTRPLKSKSPVIVDAGANRGHFSKNARKMFGGKYFLVEPNPELVKTLSESFRRVDKGIIYDKNGQVKFNISNNDMASSVLRLPDESPYDATHKETIVVSSTTLSKYMKEKDIKEIDLLKMDIEGAEISVLNEVSEEVLQRIGQITVEFHGKEVFDFGLKEEVEKTIKRMKNENFVVIDFTFPNRIDVVLINRGLVDINKLKEAWWKISKEYIASARRKVRYLINK